MDKNMINIDDLFRQRMNGEEERDRPAAWLRMSELLDEKMPVNGGNNWRRTLGYLSGLLLLATATFGGYEAIHAFRGHANENKGAVAIAGNIPATTIANSAVSKIESNKVVVADNKLDNNILSENNNQTPKVRKHTVSANHSNEGATKSINNQPAKIVSAGSVAANNITSKEEKNNAVTNPSNSEKAKTIDNGSQTIADVKPVTSHKVKHDPKPSKGHQGAAINNSSLALSSGTSSLASVDKKDADSKHEKLATANISLKQPKIKASGNNIKPQTEKIAKAGHTSSASANQYTSSVTSTKIQTIKVAKVKASKPATTHFAANNNTTSNAAKTSNKKIVALSKINNAHITPASSVANKVNAPAETQLKKEQITKLDIREYITINHRSQIATVHFDTISRDELLMVTNGRQGAQNQLLAGNIGPENGNTPGSSSSSDGMTPQDAAGKKSGMHSGNLKNNGWSMDRVQTMIDNFKYNFKHIELTPGVTAGINATFFGNSGLKGFQMGVSENAVINDQWSFMVDFKYFNRFNNITINDNYVFYDNPTGNQWIRHNPQNSYSFSTVQSLELPLALRYSYKHFIISGGANIVYNFAINTNFIDANYIPSSYVSEPGTATQPQLSGNSFASRWGLGYLAGIGYEFAPGIEFDLRMTQTLMDNTKTTGAKIISNDLYNMPSMQLSIGYHLVHEHKMIRR